MALACLTLSGCAGYQLGEAAKPTYLRDIHTISVPTFVNKTLLPRIEVLVTDTVIKQIQQDGTYRVASGDHADAVLQGEITRISRSPARSLRGNVLATTEFRLNMRVRYKLVRTGTNEVLAQGETSGATDFFVSSDVVTDERQALPLAAEELGTHLVTQISEGW